jgi:exonuclease-1
MVAPYEADAQLAYLYQQKEIDLVLTEDSDLLLFGASKCFFKMDLTGKGFEIDLIDLPKCDLF